jgi:hypothetical protein
MIRFVMSASVAAVGLALFAVGTTQADSRSGGHSHMTRGHERPNHFDYRRGHDRRGSDRFGYDRHGYRSLSWSHYRWSNDYRCYTYWSPSYRSWFFYEPTYAYYVPVTRYREVYPEATPTVVAPIVRTPSVVQQTTVVVGSPAPVAPLAPLAEVGPPAPIAPIAPAPVAVQNTKVGPGVP